MIGKSKHMVRVLAKGGILTPAYLLKIIDIAKLSGNKHIHFGSRQDLLFSVAKQQKSALKTAFDSIHTDFIIHNHNEITAQNVVSSYVSSDISASTNWLTSGKYLNILESFSHSPLLRVNISDPKQSLVPLFSGHLNFIASPFSEYWYFFIRKNYDSQPICWPVLVLSNDISLLAQTVEKNWDKSADADISELFDSIHQNLKYNWRKIENKFKIENLPPQDYEGFGRMNNSSNFWAGFYWRNNSYDIPFLEEVCKLCFATNISKICITPWKSFLIKDIQRKDKILWQRLLGRFGINMQHSAFELNWHLPLQDKQALSLKKFLVQEFDKVDVSVYGLTFGIKTKPEPSFCTIQIEKIHAFPFFRKFELFNSYKVSYASQFNANTCYYVEFSSQVPQYRLSAVLLELTHKYYGQLTEIAGPTKLEKNTRKAEPKPVYQCSNCLTVYDPMIEQLSFQLLPEAYNCPLCDSPKSDYKPIDLNQLVIQTTE